MNDYLSVKEFAAAANVSTQYIYKILDKQLQPYVIKISGKTKINVEALEKFKVSQPVAQPVSQPVSQLGFCSDTAENQDFMQPVAQLVSQPVSQPKGKSKAGEIEALNRLIEELKQDKEYLQQQIEKQNKLVDTLQERIAADGRRLENMQMLLDQQQKLTLVDKISAPAAEEAKEEQKEIEEPLQKKGFFAKLFNI